MYNTNGERKMGQFSQHERQDYGRPESDPARSFAWGAEPTPCRELWPTATIEINPTMKDRVLGALLLIKGARLVAFEEPPR